MFSFTRLTFIPAVLVFVVHIKNSYVKRDERVNGSSSALHWHTTNYHTLYLLPTSDVTDVV